MLQYYDILWKATRNEEYFKNIVEYVISSGVNRNKVLSLTGQWSDFREKPIYLRFSILVKLICIAIGENIKLMEELKITNTALKLLEKLKEDLIMEINEYKVNDLFLDETLSNVESVISELKSLKKS